MGCTNTNYVHDLNVLGLYQDSLFSNSFLLPLLILNELSISIQNFCENLQKLLIVYINTVFKNIGSIQGELIPSVFRLFHHILLKHCENRSVRRFSVCIFLFSCYNFVAVISHIGLLMMQELMVSQGYLLRIS